MRVKPENLQGGKLKREQTTVEYALRNAVIYHYIGQTPVALRRNTFVVDTSDEKRREEDDEAHGAVVMSQ
jgi:hypothetical protein